MNRRELFKKVLSLVGVGIASKLLPAKVIPKSLTTPFKYTPIQTDIIAHEVWDDNLLMKNYFNNGKVLGEVRNITLTQIGQASINLDGTGTLWMKPVWPKENEYKYYAIYQ